MFWLSYERWDFTDFGGFWYKSGGRTTGVGVLAGNRLSSIFSRLNYHDVLGASMPNPQISLPPSYFTVSMLRIMEDMKDSATWSMLISLRQRIVFWRGWLPQSTPYSAEVRLHSPRRDGPNRASIK